MDKCANVTELLIDWNNGKDDALSALMDEVYSELRRLAHSYARKENSDQTLQTTALVNEAYVRLIDQSRVQWQNRAHFFGIAAQCMRRIVVDQARRRNALKRGGGADNLAFDDAIGISRAGEIDVERLNDALEALEQIDPRQAHVVELRFFGGLEVEEAAEVLKVSPATTKREWRSAKAWLHRELRAGPE